MAFKPISVTETINGVKFVAQYNGVSMINRFTDETQGRNTDACEFLFKHVLVEPKIDDIDEFFGTNTKYMNKVIDFCGKVMNADPQYFPDNK